MNKPIKKILFIDRDGVLLTEPSDEQIDDISKIQFPKNMLLALSNIAMKLDYKLVMVTNQDGLGTASFTEKTFWPTHELLLRTLDSVGVQFDYIHIDRSFPQDNSPYRKPGTAMLTSYMNGEFDIANSFVIGDRESDMQLAKNLGCKGIRFNAFDQLDKVELQEIIACETANWNEIEHFLFQLDRTAKIVRRTNETSIDIDINLDGSGKSHCITGLNFFDHMLDQIARHSGIDLTILAKGDLEIDEHHTIEDVAIAVGKAIDSAIGKKAGIARYGFALPMDDCRAQALLDFSGRSWLEWEVDLKREYVGDFPTEMLFHFFKSLANNANMNLHIIAKGDNEHHKIESIFKAFARALRMAIARQDSDYSLPTTKGML